VHPLWPAGDESDHRARISSSRPLWLTPISLWQRDREPGAARHVEARPDHERPELPRPTPLGRGRVAGSGRSWV